MRLLVTGASGLLGTPLCELAAKRNYQLYATYSQHPPLHGSPLKLDLTNAQAIVEAIEKTEPEAIVHAAALTDVDKCEKEKDLASRINTEATATIAKLCSEHGTFLLYVSTDYVFNGKKGMYKETDKPNPINHYGHTKLKGEESVRESKSEYCIVRTSVIYGTVPAVGKTNFALWLLDRLKRKEETKIVTDQWNSPTLNTNLAKMILEIIEKRTTGIFHLAGATRLSRFEFAQLLAQTFNLDSAWIKPALSREMPWTSTRPKDSSLDVRKATETFRTKPAIINEALLTMKEEMGGKHRAR